MYYVFSAIVIYIYTNSMHLTNAAVATEMNHLGKLYYLTNLNRANIWGWTPLLTMIPVREDSEVVIIYPDYYTYNYIYLLWSLTTIRVTTVMIVQNGDELLILVNVDS